jgi:biopolymer transport protein ExbB/TolQ
LDEKTLTTEGKILLYLLTQNDMSHFELRFFSSALQALLKIEKLEKDREWTAALEDINQSANPELRRMNEMLDKSAKVNSFLHSKFLDNDRSEKRLLCKLEDQQKETQRYIDSLEDTRGRKVIVSLYNMISIQNGRLIFLHDELI